MGRGDGEAVRATSPPPGGRHRCRRLRSDRYRGASSRKSAARGPEPCPRLDPPSSAAPSRAPPRAGSGDPATACSRRSSSRRSRGASPAEGERSSRRTPSTPPGPGSCADSSGSISRSWWPTPAAGKWSASSRAPRGRPRDAGRAGPAASSPSRRGPRGGRPGPRRGQLPRDGAPVWGIGRAVGRLGAGPLQPRRRARSLPPVPGEHRRGGGRARPRRPRPRPRVRAAPHRPPRPAHRARRQGAVRVVPRGGGGGRG
jgi:hypothetical protein